MAKKKEKVEKITDILEERFDRDGEEWVKKTYMNGKKKIKEETVRE